uniref:Putative ovule protein n=1 Tax=Solanum chacoense TaxID=4108 RepID=A0A0V0IBN0_SOLCH
MVDSKLYLMCFFSLKMKKVPHKEQEKQTNSKISPQKSLNIQKGKTNYNNLLHTEFDLYTTKKSLKLVTTERLELFDQSIDSKPKNSTQPIPESSTFDPKIKFFITIKIRSRAQNQTTTEKQSCQLTDSETNSS